VKAVPETIGAASRLLLVGMGVRHDASVPARQLQLVSESRRTGLTFPTPSVARPVKVNPTRRARRKARLVLAGSRMTTNFAPLVGSVAETLRRTTVLPVRATTPSATSHD